MKTRSRFTITLVLGFGLLQTACSLLHEDYADSYRQPPKDLHEIMAVRLTEQSRTAPVTVEQATARKLEEAIATTQPAEELELSLGDVRAAALSNNLDLKIEYVNPAIDQESVNEEEAAFEALLFGSVTRRVTDQPSYVVDGAASQSQSTDYDLGVEVPLRTGGTVTVDMPYRRYDDRTVATGSEGNNSTVIDPSYAMGLQFSISQPLLRGAGVRTNTHSIRVAKYQKEVTDARTKLAAIRVLADADRAYWLLYAARRELLVRQEQYELALQQLSDARKRVEAGDSPEIEIMRAESGVAGRLEAIIVADTYVRRRERELKRIMNRTDLPMNAPTALMLDTDPNPLGLKLDVEGLIESALAGRMELLELELRLAIDSSTIDYERNKALPWIALDYTYRMNGVSDDADRVFHNAIDNDYVDHTLALRAEVPLGNEAAKARVRRAMLQRVQRLATREQRRQLIMQEVYDAVDGLEQDWQRILAARQEVILSGRTYEAEKRQFELGLRTSTDVLEAAARLANAQSREIQALAAYEISLIDIAYATGNVIGRSDVIWEPTALD